MSYFDEEIHKHLYPISLVLNPGKFNATMRDLGAWIKHQDVRLSKTVGWYCELCGSKSKPKRHYKHTLAQRVQWHLNGRCKWDINNVKTGKTTMTAKMIYDKVTKNEHR